MSKDKSLVIVESPTKARTIQPLLGSNYHVLASMGHVRDLPQKELGVDIENGFTPHYVTAPKKREAIKRLKEAVQEAGAIYLATDPDREGEAIAWHVLQVARPAAGVPVHRVTFHQITPAAVREAFQQAGALNMALVEAQQARRVLDRLVGYKVSPLLWKRVSGKGLSAGRVQTAALRLVVEREREIAAFVPVEYWSLHARLQQRVAEPVPFLAELWRIGEEKPDLKNRADAEAIIQSLQGADYAVDQVETKRQERQPDPPFTTSTMQQAASSRLHFSPAQTMRLAQQLYEGVDVGEGSPVGLITYMRTDSTHIAPEAQQAARELIARIWGTDYLPLRPPQYKTKVKSAQEAHEAIRPTDVNRTPKAVRPYLDEKQAALYELIWRRFVASQMAAAVYDVTTAFIATARDGQRLPYLFRARGRVCLFDGFLKVYEEVVDEEEKGEEEGALPPLKAGEPLDLLELIPEQHWTKPPPRYTEASLIKALEQRGIGRPSTYASIVSTIKDRRYVEREKRYLVPTELGCAVLDLLVAFFPDLFAYEFTARMEDELDDIANGQRTRLAVLNAFWAAFEPQLQRAQAEMPRVEIQREPPQPTGEKCPLCGGELVRRQGRYGPFIGCANFPKCRYIQRQEPEKTGRQCPLCGGDLVIRRSKRGPFVGCSNYPECKYVDRSS
ncbi:MAG: type I DNA topoisomerase [Anaerolineae bacterium]|nr:type I DNA topoisomerase [Anaerolineae bacterium]